MSDPHRALAGTLARRRPALLAAARARLGDADLAEDVVQEAALRALDAAGALRDPARLDAWLDRVVRNAVTDALRRRARARAALERLAREEVGAEAADDRGAPCACAPAAVTSLATADRELIERLELGGETPEAAAVRLGVTRNALKVRRHRARRRLRATLAARCGPCAAEACYDCSCPPTP